MLLHHLDDDESPGLQCEEIFVRHISTTSGWRSMKGLKPKIYSKVTWMERMVFNSFVTFQKVLVGHFSHVAWMVTPLKTNMDTKNPHS